MYTTTSVHVFLFGKYEREETETETKSEIKFCNKNMKNIYFWKIFIYNSVNVSTAQRQWYVQLGVVVSNVASLHVMTCHKQKHRLITCKEFLQAHLTRVPSVVCRQIGDSNIWTWWHLFVIHFVHFVVYPSIKRFKISSSDKPGNIGQARTVILFTL